MKKVIFEKCLAFLIVFFIISTLYNMISMKHTIHKVHESENKTKEVDSNPHVDKTQQIWNEDKPFMVCQNKKRLEAFESFAKASIYAGKYQNTYIYYYNNKKMIWTNTNSLRQSMILKVPMISQMPELARGCEVTSLAMMLQFAGVKVNKMILAKEIKKDSTPYEEKNGEIYYGHPNVGFVGDIYTFKNMGYGVYHKPIKALAEKYLPNQIIDLTGCNWNDLLYFISQGTPIWVITNGSFKELSEDYFQQWNTPYGPIRITMKEHSVLVTGYDEHYVYINNPLKKERNQKVRRKDFYSSWKQMGRQAITYIK